MNIIILRKDLKKDASFEVVQIEAAKNDYAKSLRWGSDEYISDSECDSAFESQINNTVQYRTEMFFYVVVDLDTILSRKPSSNSNPIIISECPDDDFK